MDPMTDRMRPNPFRLAVRYAVLGTVLGLPASAWAWEIKAFYPTALDPTMPTAQEAQRLAAEPPLLLRTLGQAHRQAMQLGLHGVSPPIQSTAQVEYDRHIDRPARSAE